MSINLFVVSSSAWHQARPQSLGAIQHIDQSQARRGAVVKIDLAAAKGVEAACSEDHFVVVPINDLIRKMSTEYEADAEAIKETVIRLAGAERVSGVIDASAFHNGVTRKVLNELREHAYSMDRWPSSITVVSRDDVVEDSIDDLAATFFLMPSRRSLAEASTYALRVHRAATYARFFMWSQSATGRAFKLRDKIDRLAKTLFKRDEADMV